MRCESVSNCGYFASYNRSRSVTCQILVELYCCGERADLCKRKQYFEKCHTSPVADMMPDGRTSFVVSK